jgi:agmatine/peptidylarginine deiminase
MAPDAGSTTDRSPEALAPPESGWGDPRPAPAPARSFSRRLLYSALAILIGWSLALAVFTLSRLRTSPLPDVRGVLPGEFERCDGLLLAPDMESDEAERRALLEVIAQASKHVQVYVLVQDRAHQEALAQAIQGLALQGDVRFLDAPFHSTWVRDYGPLVVKSFEGGYEMLDFDYAPGYHARDRQLDDWVPSAVAKALGFRLVSVPLSLEGGNVLSNGAGLCLTTTHLQSVNPDCSERDVARVVRRFLGGQQLVILEPLVGEATGHVDMFCTFTAPDTVVVAQCDPADDADNAAVLNRNARVLSGVKTHCGPLKVVRVPMPPRTKEQRWLTYTNVVYANGLLIVPSYRGAAKDLEEQALATYRRLLPGWKVVSVDATPLVSKLGSLHCAALNLYGIQAEPGSPAVEAAP